MSWDSPPLLLQGRMNSAPAIAYRVFVPSAAPKILALVTFGYFENMKRYREVVERWNARGIAVALYDLRGHGLSEGRRGFISRFSDYTDDVDALLGELAKTTSLAKLGPPVLLGHSLGGLISILAALGTRRPLAGLALSSPYLALAQKVPAIKLIPGRILSRLLPGVSMPAGVRGADCTRSQEIAEAYEDDPMNFKNANVRWFTETTRAQNEALERAPEIKIPVFCVQGAADKIAQAAATEHFMAKVGSADKEFIMLPEHYHEVLNEPDRASTIEKFASAMLRWGTGIKAGSGSFRSG
jgi:alpha-beta hydrolase superfamily lysophospholipase